MSILSPARTVSSRRIANTTIASNAIYAPRPSGLKLSASDESEDVARGAQQECDLGFSRMPTVARPSKGYIVQRVQLQLFMAR